MDPISALGLATSVAGLASLAKEAFKLLGEYCIAVKDAPENIKQLREEYAVLEHVLQQLEDFLRQEKAVGHSFAKTSVLYLTIISCNTNVEELVHKLKTPSAKRYKRVLERLVWPFSESRVAEMLGTLRKYFLVFEFSLEIEHCALLSQTSEKVASILEIQRDHDIKLSHLMKEISGAAEHHKRSADQISAVLHLISSLPDISTEVQSISHHVQVLAMASHDEVEARILDWISTAPISQRHHSVRNARTPGTGQWLLAHTNFKAWLASALPTNTLWCVGDPGVGKTFLASVVIDHLHNLFVTQNVGIAYLYCDGTPEVSSNFATRLLKQIAMQMKPLPQEIFDFYESHKRMGLPSSSAGFSKIFQLLCPCFRSLFVVIDALDEVKNHTDRKEILQVLKILESAGSNILVTSRPHLRDVNNALQHAKWIDIKAREEDIQAYLRRTLEDDDRLHDLVDDALRASILRKISEGARGMFLVAVLQIRLITCQETTKGIRKTLQNISTDLSKLFEESIQRLESRSAERKDIAVRTLMWLSCARRPLQVLELLHALATQPGALDFDPEDCPPIKTVIESCSGLVTIDNESSTIRLVHSTLQDFLVTKRQVLFPEAQTIITNVCLTYLLFDPAKFATENGDNYCGGDLDAQILSRMPFFAYASTYWGHHANETSSEEIRNLALAYLLDDNKTTRAANIRGLHMSRKLKAENSQRRRGLESHVRDVESEEIVSKKKMTTSGLHTAAFFNLADLLIPLLDSGASVDLADPIDFGNTALHVAAFEGHVNVAILLLDRGANVNARNKELNCPLFLATSAGHLETVELLLNRGALPDISRFDGWRALHKAADMGYLELVRTLLEHGAGVHTGSCRGVTALSRAAGRGNIEVVSLLLKNDADINCVTSDRWTPLHGAAISGQTEVVRLLLEEGADPSFPNQQGCTPLHHACRGGSCEVVALILQRGVDCLATESRGRIALHDAAEGGHGGVLKLLLEQDPLQLIRRDERGRTPRDLAISAGEYECARLLRQAERSFPGQQDEPKTKLELAVKECDETSLIRLLEEFENKDIDATNTEGLTPLHQAMQDDLYSISSVLLEHGANIEAEGPSGWRALHYAARKGNPSTVQLCLSHGADIGATTSRGQTALHKACQNGNVETIRILLQSGANIEVEDRMRSRPLHIAAWNGNDKALLLLLDHGADLKAKDRKGRSVHACAAQGGHHGLVEVVRGQNNQKLEFDD